MKTVFDIREMGVILHQEEIGHNNYFGERNKAWISGRLEEEFQYSHTVRGKIFYKNRISTMSKGGQEYFVPIIVSENILRAIESKSVTFKAFHIYKTHKYM